MADTARVTSLEAVERFRAALAEFGHDARTALDATEMETRRAIDRLHELRKRWEQEVEVRERLLAEARIQLNRKKLSRIFGHQPDCTVEEENFRRAKARLQHAEEKVVNCRRWEPRLRHAVMECEGPCRQLAEFLDVQLRQGLAVLQRKVEALDQYVRLKPGPQAR